jgi:hypothetical protein
MPVVPVHAPGYAVYVQTVPKELRVGAGLCPGAQPLNMVPAVVTLGIGRLIWTMITWASDSANLGHSCRIRGELLGAAGFRRASRGSPARRR